MNLSYFGYDKKNWSRVCIASSIDSHEAKK